MYHIFALFPLVRHFFKRSTGAFTMMDYLNMTDSHLVLKEQPVVLFFHDFPHVKTLTLLLDWQENPILRSSLTGAITQDLSITCSKMNEDGLCVIAQAVYIYLIDIVERKKRRRRTNRGRKPLLMYM